MATATARGPLRLVAAWSGNLVVLALVAGLAAWIAPSFFGYSRYVITGPSMTGTHDKGSVVFEKPVAVDDLRVGDVITYLPPPDSGVPNLVTHRIARMEPAEGGGTVITTKGDANPTADTWHFQLVDEVQPVVRFSVPHAGWLFIALAHREVRMLMIGVPALLIALSALRDLVRAVRDTRRRPVLSAAPAAPVAGL